MPDRGRGQVFKLDKNAAILGSVGSTITIENTTTNAPSTALAVQHNLSSGSPAIGIGTRLNFNTESLTGSANISARIVAILDTVTASVEDSHLEFHIQDGGSTTKILNMDIDGIDVTGGAIIGGNIEVSGTTESTIKLTDSNSAITTTVASVIHDTDGGTGSDGIGTRINLVAPSASGTEVAAASIAAVLDDTTHTLEHSIFKINTLIGGGTNTIFEFDIVEDSNGRRNVTSHHTSGGLTYGKTACSRQLFTSLTTTGQSATGLSIGLYVIVIQAPNGDSGTFLLTGGKDNANALDYANGMAANCTVAQDDSGGNILLTISIGGYAITDYELFWDRGGPLASGIFRTATATATGTTALYIREMLPGIA